ncbi:MAG: discoidin domain-containing protein [Bryobacteraceae bacterium]
MSLLDRLREFISSRLGTDTVASANHARTSPAPQSGLWTGRIQTTADYFGRLAGRWRPTTPTAKKEAFAAVSVALLATLVFYGQALVNHSLGAGFLYTGDFLSVWLPLVAKVNSLVQHGAFSGIDFSTHGGASDFFIRPGLYPYHPLLLVYSFLSHSAAPERLMRFSVILLALHSFAGCYFAVRLGCRYLKLGIGAAIFVAVGYSFSVQMVHALGFPPFLLSTALVPWAIYAGLAASDRPSTSRVVLCSLPVFLILLGGYSVIAVTCLVVSWGFITAYLLYIQASSQSLRMRLAKLAFGTAPFLVAGIVVLPLYWAMLRYFPLGRGSEAMTMFHAAHEVAEQPRTILRLLSTRLDVAGPYAEFTLAWGIIAVVISAIFFAGLRDLRELSESEWRLFKICASVYAFIVLAIYGTYSAASDLLYFVPGIGMMHIYQRHLLVTHFFFIVAMALMLKAVTRRATYLPTKATLFALAALLAFCAHAVAEGSPIAKDLHLNDYIVFELLLGLLFTASLLVPGKWFVFLVATFLMFLGPLNHMYDFSTAEGYSFGVQRAQNLTLDKENNSRVLSYFRSHSQKSIVKYVDLQPGIVNYFPRNYPWFTVMDVPLSSYGGYDFLQAPRTAYGRRMVMTPLEGRADYWLMRPDWKWVAQTGAEFVVYQDGFRLNDPHLGEVADLRDPSRLLRLPNNVVIAPLRSLSFPSGFPGSVKGRYVRVQLVGANYLSLAEVRVLGTEGNAVSNLAQGKAAAQSSLFTPAGPASNAVDGNTNGDFTAGSVTHTNLDSNAWWQVDLGTSAIIHAIEIWNRTDGAQERLNDYWVFVSDKPFSPTDTPASLQGRAGTVGNHQTKFPNPVTVIRAVPEAEGASQRALFDNGYLKVVGPEAGAVVKGFHTDGAAELTLDVDASRPVKVQYLFWPNDRLKFYLQGDPVDAPIEDGLQTVSVPAGRQHLEIRYVYWPLRFFLLLYILYAVSLAAAVVVPLTLAALACRQVAAKA